MQKSENPYRIPYVFPPKPEVKTIPKTSVKQLFIGFGIQLFVYSWVFGCLMYIKEPKWFCMTVATLTSMLAANFYWIKNVIKQTTSKSDNSTNNNCSDNNYQ